MNDFWLAAARAAIVAVIGLVTMLVGDPVVRRVFRWAGEVPPPAVEAGLEMPALGPTEDAAAVAVGTDLGEAGPMTWSGPQAAPGAVVPTTLEAAGARLRGGKFIGWLERIAAYATILAAFPAGLAILVAVKGLARYPDLKASDGTAERFILGTFASLLIASGGAGLARWVLGVLP